MLQPAKAFLFRKGDQTDVGIWGWATWRRAWKHYDVDLHRWKSLRDTQFLYDILGNDAEVELW